MLMSTIPHSSLRQASMSQSDEGDGCATTISRASEALVGYFNPEVSLSAILSLKEMKYFQTFADDTDRLRLHHNHAVPDDDGHVQAVLHRDAARGEGPQARVRARQEQGHGRPPPPDRGLHAKPKRLLSHCDHKTIAFYYGNFRTT